VIAVEVAEAVERDGDELGDGALVEDSLEDLEDVGVGTATGDLRKSWSSCSVQPGAQTGCNFLLAAPTAAGEEGYTLTVTQV
jgi:hypothetical protein